MSLDPLEDGNRVDPDPPIIFGTAAIAGLAVWRWLVDNETVELIHAVTQVLVALDVPLLQRFFMGTRPERVSDKGVLKHEVTALLVDVIALALVVLATDDHHVTDHLVGTGLVSTEELGNHLPRRAYICARLLDAPFLDMFFLLGAFFTSRGLFLGRSADGKAPLRTAAAARHRIRNMATGTL